MANGGGSSSSRGLRLYRYFSTVGGSAGISHQRTTIEGQVWVVELLIRTLGEGKLNPRWTLNSTVTMGS